VTMTEFVAEDAALTWLGRHGCGVLCGPDIAAGELGAECSDPGFRDVRRVLADGIEMEFRCAAQLVPRLRGVRHAGTRSPRSNAVLAIGRTHD